jgi:hypothetical protein
MILDSFFQDIRVGLRVLFKDKTFCFLAVLVFLPKTFGRTLALPSALNIGADAMSSIRQQN